MIFLRFFFRGALRRTSRPRWRLPGLLAILFLGLIMPRSVFAGPASADVVELTQPDGTRFPARLRGDEWFNWNETADGYVIGQDTDRRWKYRRPRQDRADFDIVPGAEVGKTDPAALGLRKHDLPPAGLIRERVRALRESGRVVPRPPRSDATGPAATPSSPGAAGGAGTEEEASSGGSPPPSAASPDSTTLRCVVILAAFSDHWSAGAPLASRGKPRADYDALLNTLGYSADGAAGSARDYYREVSYGKTDIQFVVSNWVVLPQTEAYYGDNANEASGAQRVRTLAADALAAADTAGFNFADGDGNGDGWVDLLVIIHSGFSESLTGNPATCIWPRQWSLPDLVTRDGKKMSSFAVTAGMRGQQSSSTGIMRIGTLVHEMGHLFGLPDLYDAGNATRGLGTWCLMAYGSWGNSGTAATELRPTHLGAFAKSLLGYLDPVPVHSQASQTLPRAATSPSAHLLAGSADATEYFLVENRGGSGFDADLPAGLLITHVDTRAVTTANHSGLFPAPAVRVEEANGGDTLRAAISAQAGQVWTASNGLAGGFRDATGDPETNAMTYQSGNTYQYTRLDNAVSYTGITADAFSPAGPVMTYRLQTRVPTLATPAPAYSGGYTVSWSAASGAARYEIQEGSPATATVFTDDAESLAAMRDNWKIFGAVTRSTLGNATSGGSACYELAAKLPGPDNTINTADDYFLPEYRGLELRAPFTLTASSSISFKYLSRVSSGYGALRVQLTKNDGASWATLGSYTGNTTSWTTITYPYTTLVAAGFAVGDRVRLRFVVVNETLWGWTAFPAYGYALDEVRCTGIARDSTNWTTLANNVTGTSQAIAAKAGGSIWRYRVRAYSNSAWRDWSPVATVTVSAAVLTPLASWRQTYFGTPENTGQAADDQDPDGDGVANLLEYALAGLPLQSAPGILPAVSAESDHLRLSFFRARAELTYLVEASSDLVTWETIATNPGQSGEEVTVTDPVSFSTSPRFLRLRVSP